jgi:hypothetical protein
VWNGIFRQAQYTREEGMKLHLDTHSYRAGMKYYNKRSAEIMDLWETVCSQYSYFASHQRILQCGRNRR